MRILWAAAAAALMLSSLSACSSTTKGKPASKSATSTPAPTGPASSSSSDGQAHTEAQLRSALLTPTDVGNDFTEGTYSQGDSAEPCDPEGSPSFGQKTSPDVHIGVVLSHVSPNADFEEQIYQFADADAAQKALTVAEAGLACTTGKSYGADGSVTEITIEGPIDITADLGADTAEGWKLRTAIVRGSTLAALIGSEIAVFSFVARTTTDTTSLPNPASFAKLGIEKIKNS